MDYVSCAEARAMRGLRLVLGAGAPGPWGEAAKGVLRVRHVGFTPVARIGMDPDPELFEWTGQHNAPVAMYEDERPRHTWVDILYLAERIGHGPSLLPVDRAGQAECIGLSHEICGEDGLGWNRRLDIFKAQLAAAGGDPAKTIVPPRLWKDYLGTEHRMELARDRVVEILTMFDQRLAAQADRGSRYLVRDEISAPDIYLACFLGMLYPLPHEQNPMPEPMRALYSDIDPEVAAALSPLLLLHRDFIYRSHLTLPMDF